MTKQQDELKASEIRDARITTIEDFLGAEFDDFVPWQEDTPQDPPPPKKWQETDDLCDPEGRLILGVHYGGGSDSAKVEALLGRKVELTTVYWNTLKPIADAAGAYLAAGVLPRLELEITTALCAVKANVETLWVDIAAGVHDAALTPLLASLSGLGRVPVSICHEADYAPAEQGGYDGKRAGEWSDFGPMFRHVVEVARSLGVNDVKWYFNMGGGYNGAPSRWDAMYPGDDVVDIVGFDAFNPAGVRGSTDWRGFAEQVQRYGRLAWCKSKGKPVWIGETGTCEVAGHNATEWVTDMPVAANSLGIDAVIYFSDRYADHTRALDDGVQKPAALPLLGQSDLIAWSAT